MAKGKEKKAGLNTHKHMTALKHQNNYRRTDEETSRSFPGNALNDEGNLMSNP